MTATDDELIISGDGKTPETAVRFKPCHVQARVLREMRFVCEQFGIEGVDWEEELHFTTLDEQSVWAIRSVDGTKRNVYFDTSQTIYDNG